MKTTEELWEEAADSFNRIETFRNLVIQNERECAKPFGWWHEGETDDESDFFPAEYCHNAGEGCPSCVPLFTFPPAPQPCPNCGDFQRSYFEIAAEIRAQNKELEKQAAEIAKLKAVIAKCEGSLRVITRRANHLDCLDIAREANEALAAIKEIEK